MRSGVMLSIGEKIATWNPQINLPDPLTVRTIYRDGMILGVDNRGNEHVAQLVDGDWHIRSPSWLAEHRRWRFWPGVRRIVRRIGRPYL